MSKQINKIVDNYPVLLNSDEKDNLVKTLSSIILEVAPGGSGGGKTYYGAEGVYVDNDNNRITLESTAKNAIDNIPHAVTDLTDSADYQLKSGMTNYLTTATYEADSATFLTQTSASQNLAPISVTADIEALKANSGDFSQYYKKTDTSSKEELSAEFDKYQTIAGMNDYVTNQGLADAIIELDNSIALKQNKLVYDYDETGAISSIDGTPLAGQGGTTYTEGNGISIASDTISISADYIQAITSVSAIKGTVLTGDANIRTTSAEDGNNIKWTLELTAQPTVTDTTLSGADGIVAVKDSSVTSQWNVTIAQAYRQEIEAVSGKLTKSSADTLYAPISVTGDVNTLKSASGNWDKISDKLDTTAFSTVSGSFLTSHQSLDNYYTKTQVDSTFASSTQLNDYLTTATYQTDSGTFLTKSSADNDYAPKSVTATINTLTAASAGWNEVTAKLDKSIYANASGNWENTYNTVNQYSAAGTWLTAHQPLTDYYTKSDTSSKNELSTEFAKYQPTGYYATTAQLNTASSTLTGVDNLLSGHIDYVSGQVDNKLNVPLSSDVSIQDKYLVLRTNANGTVSGWCDFQGQSYSKSEANGTFVATANIDTTTLSGDGKSVSTKLGVKTDVIATRDYVNSSFLPLSGGTVSGDVVVSSSGTCLLTVGTEATLMGQSRVVNMGDTTARGTNWLGVTQSNQGFLKYVNGGNVGALNGTSIQINFAPDGANSYGNITVNSQDNMSKVINVPTASYNSMSSFDNTNGPNYMLRKTASGFDIGAAVINVTQLPAQTEANTYYFIYDT